MSLFIGDGSGSGGGDAAVKNGKLRVYGVVEEEQAHANEDNGTAFSILIDQATSAGDDQFFYIKNSGESHLHITSMKGFVAGDTEIKVLMGVTGTPTSGSALTPVNRNAGSANPISGTIEQGADLQLTDGSIVDLFEMAAAATGLFKISWGSSLILPKNGTLCLESSAATTINLTISCFLHG